MAQPASDEIVKKKRRGGTVIAWVLMAMIIAGLGSFGVTNFSGGKTAIGKVGETEITVNDYARAMRQEMNAFSAQIGQPVSFVQAQSFGLDQQVLQSTITRAALDDEASKIGLSASDSVVFSEIKGLNAFQGASGEFDVPTYKLALESNNLTEAEFEQSVRLDVARQVLQGAIVGGFASPVAMEETVFAWASEQRGFSVLRLTEADLATPLAEPTEAELTAYYDANIATFTRPEAKRISYVSLLPDTLAKEMPADEAALKTLYDQKLAEYVIPEKRLVERLVYATEAEAAEAKARLDAGETFEALVAERKLTLADIDLGDVSKADLGAAGEAVFALTEPGVTGPLMSDLGPALFRMNAVLAAQETTFEQARPALLVEIQTDAARRAIADKIEDIDDALAGGATFADLVKDHGMVQATTDYAVGTTDNDPIAGYADFRKAADALAQGDFPEAVLLDDGGVVALQFVETVPPTPRPFADVADKVAEAVKATALAAALSAKAAEVQTAIAAGGTLAQFGIVQRSAAMDRAGFVADAPDTLLKAVFEMTTGEVREITADGFAALVQLDSITPADPATEDATALREALSTQVQQGIANDAFTLYSKALTAQAGITLDQTAINAVNAQMGN